MKLPSWKTTSIFLGAIILTYTLLGASACGTGGQGSAVGVNTNEREVDNTFTVHKQAFENAMREVGLNYQQLYNSTELVNQLERVRRYNNPNHVSFVYFISLDGKIMFYHRVLGKCSSTDSQASSPEYITDGNNAYGTGSGNVALSAPQLDGSFGINEPGIFCFLDEPGHPIVTWNGYYFQSDKYIPLNQPPVLNENSKGH